MARFQAHGVGPCTLGPPLSEWWTLLGTKEPEFHGRPLRKWLLAPEPDAPSSEPVAEIMARAQAMLKAFRTNCIPWFLKWIQTPSDENLPLARLAFARLGTNSLVALPALVELAQSEKPATRAAAYVCLDRMAPEWEALWPALIPALHHTDTPVRVEAARYLWEHFPEQAKQSGVHDCLPLAFRQHEAVSRLTKGYLK